MNLLSRPPIAPRARDFVRKPILTAGNVHRRLRGEVPPDSTLEACAANARRLLGRPEAPGEMEVASGTFLPFLLQEHRQVRTVAACCRCRLWRRVLVPSHSRLAPAKHLQDLLAVLRAPDPEAHCGVRISLAALAAHNHGAAEVLLAAPRQVRRPAPTWSGLSMRAAGEASKALRRRSMRVLLICDRQPPELRAHCTGVRRASTDPCDARLPCRCSLSWTKP